MIGSAITAIVRTVTVDGTVKVGTMVTLIFYYYMSNKILLQLANEVLGKVMFLHLSVILFTGGCVSQHAMSRRVGPAQHAMGQGGVCFWV